MRKVFCSIFIFLSLFFTISVSNVSAKVISSQIGNIDIPKSEVVDDDLFIGGQGVTIEGTVNGDVFIGAQNIRIPGVINGSLYIGAQNVTISGTVKGNIYIGAQDVNTSKAVIGGSLFVGSQNLNLDKESQINGSLFTGNAFLTINSIIKRNVFAAAENMRIEAGTKIGNSLYLAEDGENKASIDKSAKITGQIYRSEIKVPKKSPAPKPNEILKIFAALAAIAGIFSFIGAAIVGLIYLKLCNKHFSETSNFVSKSFWKVLGIGFITSIIFVPGIVILSLSIIGIPVAGLAVLIMLIFIYMSQIVTGSAIGNWLKARFNWKISSYWSFVLGLLVIYVLKCIPVIGFFVSLIVLWLGTGSLIYKTFLKENSST